MESYTNIAKEIGTDPRDILFLSDNIQECFAARNAGFQTVNVNRPGNAEISDLDGVQQIELF